MEKIIPIEATANFEGNESTILFKRLHNEKIRDQIISLLFQSEQSRNGEIIESLETDEQGNLVFDAVREPIVKEKVAYVPKTVVELQQQYDETLAHIESVTEVEFAKKPDDFHNANEMFVGVTVPWTGKPFSVKQMSISEAHEKGHRVREYFGTYFDTYFEGAFDKEAVVYGEKEVNILRKILSPEDQDKTDDEVREMFFEYLFSAMELAERMGQLKNYYGMTSDEVFTKEHLDYARAHYVVDTDADNAMTQFFQAITPKTEAKFLELINSAGI